MFYDPYFRVPANSAPASGFASSWPVGWRRETQSQSDLQQSPQNNQQPQSQQPVVCPWSAHASPSGQSKSPFPRSSHALSPSATAAGELFLFGGYAQGVNTPSNDLQAISTRDFSTTLLRTSGDVPSRRYGHRAVLINATLLIWGGITFQNGQYRRDDDSLYLLDLVSREWTCIVVHGPGPRGRIYHTMTLVGTKLFVFGGRSANGCLNDIWALDLNYLESNLFWESYEPAPGNEKPLPRAGHVSVTTGDRVIIFGGYGDLDFNDTWSFNISTQKWTKLQCTGSIPSPRAHHDAVLVDDVMYVFGGIAHDGTCAGDLSTLNLSTQRWTAFQDIGPSPCRRRAHAMASDGRRVFVLGGALSPDAQADEAKLIHVLDTKLLIYPKSESDCSTVKHNAGQSLPGPKHHRNGSTRGLTEKEVYEDDETGRGRGHYAPSDPHNRGHRHTAYRGSDQQFLEGRSHKLRMRAGPGSESGNTYKGWELVRDNGRYEEDPDGQAAVVESSMQDVPDSKIATSEDMGGPTSPQITRERNASLDALPSQPTGRPRSVPEEGDGDESSAEHHAKLVVAPSRKEIAELEDGRLIEIEGQLLETLVAKIERDRSIAQLTDELALKSALLERVKANAAEAKKRAGLELRALQVKVDELLLSRDQALEQAQSALQKATFRALLEQAKGGAAAGKKPAGLEQRELQAKLDELLLSRDQALDQARSALHAEGSERNKRELPEVYAKFGAREPESAVVRLRLTDKEDGGAKSKAEAETSRVGTQAATGLVNMDVDRVMERVRAMEAEMASLRGDGKSRSYCLLLFITLVFIVLLVFVPFACLFVAD